MKKKNLRICVITFPFAKAFITPLSNLDAILSSFSKNLYIILGGEKNVAIKDNFQSKTQTFRLFHQQGTNTFSRIAKYIYVQIRMSLILLKLSKNIDICILFMEAGTLLPILTAKILRKKILLALPSSIIKNGVKKDVFSGLLIYLQTSNYFLSDRIILYSPNLIEEWNLKKYRNKIIIANRHFLDFSTFKIKKQFKDRENLIGYIGRLSEEKGIQNFLNAIPKILAKERNIKFFVGGDGPLKYEVESYSNNMDYENRIRFVGWIDHTELPDYLNELKLIVLPSYTEGLPNLMIEAMACGTPVLATSVGAIPDIIKDGETGFIMENNLPDCIGENIIRVLEHPDLESVVGKAKSFVTMEFTYENAIEKYRMILEDIRYLK